MERASDGHASWRARVHQAARIITAGADKTILLGPPFVFSAANINRFNF